MRYYGREASLLLWGGGGFLRSQLLVVRAFHFRNKIIPRRRNCVHRWRRALFSSFRGFSQILHSVFGFTHSRRRRNPHYLIRLPEEDDRTKVQLLLRPQPLLFFDCADIRAIVRTLVVGCCCRGRRSRLLFFCIPIGKFFSFRANCVF